MEGGGARIRIPRIETLTTIKMKITGGMIKGDNMTNIISAENVIVGLVDQLFNFGPTRIIKAKEMSNVGILFTLQIQAENYGYEKDGNTNHKEWRTNYIKYLHYIILSGRNVFLAESDKMDYKDVPMFTWNNTSNHDSCWRTDGFRHIFDTFIKAHKECWGHIPDEHRPPPIAADIDGTFTPFLGKLFKFVRVEKKYDSENHRYLLSSIKELKYTINLEEKVEQKPSMSEIKSIVEDSKRSISETIPGYDQI